MKRSLKLLTTALATLSLAGASIAATEDSKSTPTPPAAGKDKPADNSGATSLIAVLDFNRILQEAKASKGLNKQMEDLRVKYETEISKKEEALREEERQLSDQQNKKKEVDPAKQKAFEAKVAELQKSVMQQSNQFNEAGQAAMDKIRETVMNVAKDIAGSKGYSYVQPAATFVYFDPKVDITTETIAALDKALPEVKVELKEASAKPETAKADKK